MRWLIIPIFFVLFPITEALAHPGRTDAEGCHRCRSNCAQYGLQTDERHCHNAGPSQPPLAEPEKAERTGDNNLLRLDYSGFTVWVDCSKRGAVRFRYNAQRDTGDFPRHGRFHLDPEVPAACQQTSTESYRRPPGMKSTYDRGHLVPANHLDYSEAAIRQSNTMTNILPQVAQMNRGAWLRTEEIIECYRDIDELLVLGGVIWGDNSDDNYFVDSHGIETPDAYWKVIIREDRVIAWLIPNSPEATRKRLDNYLVTVESLEALTGVSIPVEAYLKPEKPEASWIVHWQRYLRRQLG